LRDTDSHSEFPPFFRCLELLKIGFHVFRLVELVLQFTESCKGDMLRPNE
jgi:hypothetical protein